MGAGWPGSGLGVLPRLWECAEAGSVSPCQAGLRILVGWVVPPKRGP